MSGIHQSPNCLVPSDLGILHRLANSDSSSRAVSRACSYLVSQGFIQPSQGLAFLRHLEFSLALRAWYPVYRPPRLRDEAQL